MPDTVDELQIALGDRYLLERQLGQGGMATVYLARDLRNDRLVAVKVLLPELGSAVGPERFAREIDIASQLEHPHILRIEDFGRAGDTLYYVMRYVAGESLADRLQAEQMLGVDEAVRITCQVASALEHAHQRGIIHRDVKPQNILLEDGNALLADFGIARAFSVSGAAQRLTQTGVTLGTPLYMSPEQAIGDRALDGRSDVYSLACVLYEMLAGQPPFVGPTAQAIMARQLLEDVPSLTVVRGAIPDALEDVVVRALEKNAADRYPTAAAFAEALEGAVADGRTTAHETTSRPRRRTPTRPQRAIARRRLTAAVVAGLLIVGGAAAGAWRIGKRGPVETAAAGEADGLSRKRIAVTYFEDLSPDRSQAPLADGLTEELIRALAGVRGLDVVSRNGVAPFRDPATPPDSIAQALGAGTIVRGTVEPRGDRLRVSVRLIDGGSGADYRRASFEVPAAHATAARDSVVDQVSRFLRTRLGEEIQRRERRSAAGNDAAWGLSLRAEKLAKAADSMQTANDTAGARAARAKADTLLVRAAALDSSWTAPIVQRGRLALARARAAADPVEAVRQTDVGLQLAQQALRVAPDDADALALRGVVRLERWRHHLEPDPRAVAALLPSAEEDLKRATRIAPDAASAWSALAYVQYEKANVVDAALAARRAYEADAYLADADRILWLLYTTAYDNQSFLDAVHWCDEGRRRFPANPLFVRCQLWLFTTNTRTPDAAAAWKLVDELRKSTSAAQWRYLGHEAQMLAAAAVGRAGQRDSADRVLVRARGGADVDPERELLTVEAFVRDLLGERDAALDLLKQYLVARPELRRALGESQSWWWRGMRSDPRFQELVGAAR